MANDYTTSTDAFQDISEGNYTSSDYPQMATFISAVSRLIDAEVGQWPGFFYPTTDSVTWYYDGSGEDVLHIDPFVSVSSVSVSETGSLTSSDYTAWGSTEYMTWPYNASGKGKPITELRVDNYNGTKANWYEYPKSVSVTGVAGYSTTTPDLVKQACKMQAVRFFMRAKQGYQDTGATAEIGGITFKGKLELDPDVKALLWPLKLELTP